MGRKPCCDKVGLKRGPWTIEEDHKLTSFILNNGIHSWRIVPKLAGLLRCGKSCRLRWINYLRPDLKRGSFTESEEDQIIELHSRLGNRWSKIASYFQGRTDNEIKNHWNTRIKKRMKLLGLDPVTHKPIDDKTDCDYASTVDKDQAEEKQEDMTRATTGCDKKETKTSDQTTDVNELLDNYEAFCRELDLEPLLMVQETKSSDSSLSNTSVFSIEESNNSSLSMNEYSSLLHEDLSLNQWIDSVEPLVSCDFFGNILEDDLFHIGK